MNKLFCFLLSLFLIIGVATAEVIPSPQVCPSPCAEDLYAVTGDAVLLWGDSPVATQIYEFSFDVVDAIQLSVFPDANGNARFCIMSPTANMSYDWFLVDTTGALVANLNYDLAQCTCGENWYEVDVRFAPNWIDGGDFYLIFVE